MGTQSTYIIRGSCLKDYRSVHELFEKIKDAVPFEQAMDACKEAENKLECAPFSGVQCCLRPLGILRNEVLDHIAVLSIKTENHAGNVRDLEWLLNNTT